jgi:tRNA-splicing ligase RtcB
MQIIKGQHNFAKVMIDEIDETTHAQIQDFVNRPMFAKKRIVVMPDCHAGAGSCIGFTMQLGDYIMPQIVGVDIGCGMLATNFGPLEVDPAKLDEFIKVNIPAGHNINEEPFVPTSDKWTMFGPICALIESEERRALRAIGSLGGGNHFIEGDRDEAGNLWIVIHSGSRNFGKRIADYFQAEARKRMARYFLDPEPNMEFIPRSDPLAGSYLGAMQMAQHYAHVNRWMMMNRIREGFLRVTEVASVESVHNYIDFDDKIIRKGAIRAHEGDLCIIPFNSAEGSALCRGKGNAEWNYSAPHGAGRLMSRTRAFAELDYKEYQAKLAEKGVYSSTANSSTLDEAPMAYKSADAILLAIEPTVEVVSMLRPFYNFKAAEGKRSRK